MEWLRRKVCRWIGHRWAFSDRGAPVVRLFSACQRCGKMR